jgi:hypothetical protein
MAGRNTTEPTLPAPATTPAPTRTLRRGDRPAELLVLVVGTVVAGIRLGPAIADAVPWAEDVVVFLRAAAQAANGLEPVWTTYAGYLHVLPRLVAAAARWLPAPWAATFLVLVCALVQGAVAALTWHVLRSLSAARWACLVAVVPVVLVPVGVETVLSLANLQWFLLYAALLAAVWSPRGWGGRSVQALVLVVTALSSPFGVLPVLALGVNALVTRSRAALAVGAAGAVAAVVQLLAMRSNSSRELHVGFDLVNLAATYLRRVVADGMLGVGRNGLATYAPGVRIGMACAGAVLLTVVLAIRVGGRRVAVRLLALFALSAAAFLVPSVLENVAGTDPGYQGRYFLAPALLWIAMIALALTWAARIPNWPRVPVRALCAVVAATILVGAALSYPVRIAGREGVPSWRTQLGSAVEACGVTPAAVETIQIAPRGWTVDLSCAEVSCW